MVSDLANKLKKFLPFLGIVILLYVIYTLDVQKLITAFRSLNPLFILGAIALNLPQLLIRNSVWQLILKQHKIKIGYLASLRVFLIGYFYGSFTPAYSGQVMRLPYLKERTGEPYGKLFFNLVIETTLHTISLYCMMLIGALLVFTQLPQVLYFVIIWLLFVALVIVYFIKKERGQRFFNVLIKYLAPRQLKEYFASFADTFYADFPHLKNLLVPMLLGVFTWLIVFTQEYIVALALGLSIPYLLFLVLYPVANTVGFLPVTFAGLGTRELTAIFIFTSLFSVPRETVFVLSIVGFVITDAFCGFIGFLLSLTEARTKEKISEIF
ncbi:MAG TPA: lysylphosphatidylglycerol synthase transmembrane domain-containing protein [Candidatus Thermoplasmatota archaeon]|nr:lysylphosphatidylglycerol synthase transmembrane domain-containing protein [Candidatus Thermoplasmatota archaeon]